MRLYAIGAAAVALLVAAGWWLVPGGGDEPASSPLAARVRHLIAQQDDGVRAILTSGEQDLRRTAGAAQALDRIGRLRESQLARVLSRLSAAWRPQLAAFADDDLAAKPEDPENRYDLLRLNVEVGEFLAGRQTGLPRPDYARLIAALEGSKEDHVRVLQARAARLGGLRWAGFADASSCPTVAGLVRRDDLDGAVGVLRRLPSPATCRDALAPLLSDLAQEERAVLEAVHRKKEYGDGDVIALDQLATLAKVAGRWGPADREAAAWFLRQMDADAAGFGAVTRPEIVAMAAGLLGGEEPPPTPHLAGRLETLLAFGGSLATGVTTDWYTTTLMAHAARMSGALTGDQAADLFGLPTMRPNGAKPADWVLGYTGLSADGAPDLSGVTVAEGDAGQATLQVARALAGTCPEVAPVDGEQFFTILALDLAKACSPANAAKLAEVARTVGRPRGLPDTSERGGLHGYWELAETACLVDGSPGLPAGVGGVVDGYLDRVAQGTVGGELFDPLDLYAALRLRELSGGGCDDGWWQGLAR
ncbi:hypothetical protein [Nonomuraea jabiensis]|uniref:hypothetical protein n=1 Tax=Nonomuraea jabiensis TaxID=882448 RepID=UPI003D717E57